MMRTKAICLYRGITVIRLSFGLSFAFLLLTMARAGNDPDLAPLERWLERMAETKSVEADFVQQRFLRTLRKPLSTKGRLWLVYPDFLRWQLGDPPATVAIRNKGKLTVIEPKKKHARLFSLESKDGAGRSSAPVSLRAMIQSFPRSIDELAEHYEIRGLEREKETYELTLEPLDKSLSAMRQVVFSIDAKEYFLRAVELQFRDKSKVRSVFTRLTFNHEIPASTFQPNLEGYQVEE